MLSAVRQAFLQQADRIGFGELSAFGDSLVRALFRRHDTDKDGALNFREMIALQRALRQVGARQTPRSRPYKPTISWPSMARVRCSLVQLHWF